MSTVYATKRFAPGEWHNLTKEKRDQVWEQLRSTCAARAASQGMTATTAYKVVEDTITRTIGDETGWQTITTVIATDVTVSCDTVKTQRT